MTTWTHSYGWSYDYDEEASYDGTPSLVVIIYREDDESIVDSLGGIEIDFDISDHGNIVVSSETEKYLQSIAEELVNGVTQ